MDRGGRREGGKWERVWSTGYRTGEVNRLPWDRSFSSFLSFLFFSPSLFLSLFLCFPFPSPSFASSTLSSLFLSFSFLASLPQVFRTDAKIYTWRLVRRCTLVWMEAGHSTAPRTVKRKIYGFQKNSLRSILEGGGEERRGRKKDTLEPEKRIGTGARKWMREGAERKKKREDKRRERPHESASVLA